MFEKITSLGLSALGRVSFTGYYWYCNVFKGCMAVASHWLERNRRLLSTLLEFQRFGIPHEGAAVCDNLFEMIKLEAHIPHCYANN